MTWRDKSPAKYKAVPTVIDGVRFASKKEARRFAELKLLEKAGEIDDLELQPRFKLLAASTTGQLAKAISAVAGTRDLTVGEYRGDFAYLCPRRGRVVEDVKGFKTPLYRWKKKHAELQYGITITEV